MSRHSVCKTTPVQHALPLHGWTKTRRLRAVTVSLDRHCSLCQIYLLNHGNCGHCFRHIHFLPGTCTGTYTVWHARTCQRHPHAASVNNNIWHSAAATRIAKNTAPPCRDSVCFQTLFLTTYCPCEIAPDTSAWDVVRTCVSVCVCPDIASAKQRPFNVHSLPLHGWTKRAVSVPWQYLLTDMLHYAKTSDWIMDTVDTASDTSIIWKNTPSPCGHSVFCSYILEYILKLPVCKLPKARPVHITGLHVC